jgi:hypothetical protein
MDVARKVMQSASTITFVVCVTPVESKRQSLLPSEVVENKSGYDRVAI